MFEPNTIIFDHSSNKRGRIIQSDSEGFYLILLSDGQQVSTTKETLDKQGGQRESGRPQKWGWYKELEGVHHFLPVHVGMPGFTFEELAQQGFEWVCTLEPTFT